MDSQIIDKKCQYYLPLTCNCKTKEKSTIQKKWSDFFNYCGSFKIMGENSNKGENLKVTNKIVKNLIYLEKTTDKIKCKQCYHKFELRRAGSYIKIFKLQCCSRMGNPCLSCKRIENKSNYSSCQKCRYQLQFFSTKNDENRCSRCNLQHCNFCKKSTALFKKSACLCRILKAEQTIKLLQILLIINVLIIIFGVAFVYYLEKTEYCNSINNVVKNWLSKSLSANGQFTKDVGELTFKFGMVLVFLFFGPSYGLLIKQLQKQFSKYKKIKQYLRDNNN